MKRIIIFLFIIAVAVLIGINLKNAGARTIEANPEDNIQDVVDGANSGDTILFNEGTYDNCDDEYEFPDGTPRNSLWVNKSLTFKSEKLPKNQWRKNGREKYNPPKVKLNFRIRTNEAKADFIGITISSVSIGQGDNSIIDHCIIEPRYPQHMKASFISLYDNSEEYTTNTMYVRNSYLNNTAFDEHCSLGESEIISENCWWGYEDGGFSNGYYPRANGYSMEVTINSWYKTPIYDNKITRGMKISNMLESQTLHNQSINNLSTSLDYYSNKLSFFKTKLYTIENNTGTNHTEYDNLKKLIETLSNSKNQTLCMLETKVTNLESNLSDAEEDIIALEKNNTNLKNQLDYQNSTIIKMNNNISTLESEIDKLKTSPGTRSEPLTTETKAIGLKEIMIPAIVIVTAVVLIGLVYRKIH